MRVWVVCLLFLLVGCSETSEGTGHSTAHAKLLAQHGLSTEAKVEFLAVLQSASSPEEKAESLYQLGQISFSEGRYKTALADWAELRQKYPSSARTKEIDERLAQLEEIVQKSSDEMLTNVVATSYIRNGDFWSNASETFSIDSSWLPSVELGTYWYDRVIKEYPGSEAAESAYAQKLRTQLGWKETGTYGRAFGAESDFKKYMPLVLQTFDEFAKAFPKNSTLQAFRFQIAQAYWSNKDWPNTRLWLQQIVSEAGENQTFYSELAKARLAKVEY